MTTPRLVEYRDDTVLLEGYYAPAVNAPAKSPAVIVIHDWSGKNEFACKKAEKLTQLGFAGFALDMYGKGKIGNTKEEKVALMQPLISDRSKLLNRILAAYDTVRELPEVDATKIAAIGFCFGGLCVLDLARSGIDVKGVVSFHGLLNAPENAKQQKIKSKILALHGYDDPMCPHDQIIAFGDEMTAAKADWQLHMYGGTMHAFTNPMANDPGFGTVYNKIADERSWQAMVDFFKEIL
ncbi:MAG TPA: dienelactone hydrolase family protein [Gammaproteobacteria bacterium]|jgi:dienelactone hydrolase|nr:dienelactone hydrolase family protein [Gammaproteobacteria bacterium]